MIQINIIDKLLDSPIRTLNLIFVGVMIGGSILILGSLYLIYDVQVFGERFNTKTDLMMVSITFTIIHLVLTNASLFAFKKIRYAKATIQKEKEKIAKKDKEKDEFVTMIAHELKNPLVPIHSYSKMLLDGKFGEMTSVQKEKMKIVISGTESMLILIQDMLDVHKAELGKIKLDLQSADLNEIIDAAVTIVQPHAEKQGVTICNYVKRNILVNVDSHRIEQVLINLIKNAIDFVPKESGTIVIDVELQDSNAVISVTDNGCGIPKEEIGKLFRKFYQINATQIKERKGSGLGLAICNDIIELHRGKMWAESDVGVGTTIKFKLPLITKNLPEVERKTLVGHTL
jgi:signal transduction histidine kinase